MNVRSFTSLAEVRQLVADFEACRLSRTSWNHRAHLTVAAWYLDDVPEPEGRRRLREGIKRYNAARGIRQTPRGGYHETLTVFWSIVVSVLLREESGRSFLERLNRVLDRLSQGKEFVFAYYTPEELFNGVARYAWVPPRRHPRGPLAAVSDALASTYIHQVCTG